MTNVYLIHNAEDDAPVGLALEHRGFFLWRTYSKDHDARYSNGSAMSEPVDADGVQVLLKEWGVTTEQVNKFIQNTRLDADDLFMAYADQGLNVRLEHLTVLQC